MNVKRPGLSLAWSINLMLLIFLSIGCATKILDYEQAEKLDTNEEYDALVSVKEIEAEEPTPEAEPEKKSAPEKPGSKEKSKDSKKESVSAKKKEAEKKESKSTEKKKAEKETSKKEATEKKSKKDNAGVREPKLEDAEGFEGRRPKNDPFRVGEKVTMALTYFNITAGTMDLMVKPFVEVNGKKSYNYAIQVKSNSMFARVYAVDDFASTLVDFETLLPSTHHITVRESKQVKDIKSYFNFDNNTAKYWEKKVTEDKGEEKKKIEWDIKAYSQNVISAAFYVRTFQLRPGKKLAFRVADEGKNIVFTGEVLRREKLKTEIGTLDTLVLKPTLTVDGVFKPVGEILLWLTDDDRKFIVRIESKIKIGTIIAKLKALKKD